MLTLKLINYYFALITIWALENIKVLNLKKSAVDFVLDAHQSFRMPCCALIFAACLIFLANGSHTEKNIVSELIRLAEGLKRPTER